MSGLIPDDEFEARTAEIHAELRRDLAPILERYHANNDKLTQIAIDEERRKWEAAQAQKSGLKRLTVSYMHKELGIGVDNIEAMARRAAEQGKIEPSYRIEKIEGKKPRLWAKIIDSGHPGT